MSLPSPSIPRASPPSVHPRTKPYPASTTSIQPSGFPKPSSWASVRISSFLRGCVGTVDLLYTRGREQLSSRGREPRGSRPGPRPGRAAGSCTAASTLRPAGRSHFGEPPSWTPCSRSETAAAIRRSPPLLQLEKRFGSSTALSAAYTFTRARDRVNTIQDDPGPNIAATPLNGTLEHRDLGISLWEKPHQVNLVVTSDLPFGFRLGLIYIGASGTPYTYVTVGDANADGFFGDAPVE